MPGTGVFRVDFLLKLPGLTGSISPGFVFLLVSVATLSWSETVAIAAVSGIVQSLWRPARRPSALQVAFNAATVAISGAVAHSLAHELSQAGGADVMVSVLGVAGVALLASNTLLVSTILCLIQEAPFHGGAPSSFGPFLTTSRGECWRASGHGRIRRQAPALRSRLRPAYTYLVFAIAGSVLPDNVLDRYST